MTRDFYDILGLSREASPEDIRRAHRTMARRFHPDTADDGRGDPRALAQVQEAYETLSNADARRRYDGKQSAARGENQWNVLKRKPPKARCAACGTEVYTSQLKLYVGRMICQACHHAKQSRAPQVQLNAGTEMKFKLARAWAQWRFVATVGVLLAAGVVGTRVAWARMHRHRLVEEQGVAQTEQPSVASQDARRAGAGEDASTGTTNQTADISPAGGSAGKD